MKYSSSNFIKVNNSMIDCYAPLLEKEFVRHAYHLPRKKRFLNFFHRDIISKLNLKLARLHTTESNMSVSDEFYYVMMDLIKLLTNLTRRLFKKISQKVFGKTIFQESPNNPNLYSEMRQIIEKSETLNILKTYKIVIDNIELDEIGDSYLGKILVISDVLRRLK